MVIPFSERKQYSHTLSPDGPLFSRRVLHFYTPRLTLQIKEEPSI